MAVVGFIGASGLMGHGMAKNLAKKFELHYTVNRRIPEGLDGAIREASNADLGKNCDVVFICVTASSDVEQVVAGPDGLLTNPRPGLIIVDSSTSEPQVTRKLAAKAAEQGVTFVDAALTRGPAQAEAGTLNLLVGASDEVFEQLKPYFEQISENIYHCGEVGAGHTIKLVNNTVMQSATTILSEGFAVCAKAGVDPGLLVDVLSAGDYSNKVLQIMGQTLHGDYAGQVFQLDNARKDVRYYTRMAGDLGVPTVVGDGVHEALELASALGFGGEYTPSLTKAQEKINGVEIKTDSDK